LIELHNNRTNIDHKLTNTDICFTDFEKLNDLKNLQKRLTAKENELNNREQVIKSKELKLDETTQKLATSKAYILNLEKKINELENSTLLNRQTSTTYNSQQYNNNDPKLANLEKRVLELRLK